MSSKGTWVFRRVKRQLAVGVITLGIDVFKHDYLRSLREIWRRKSFSVFLSIGFPVTLTVDGATNHSGGDGTPSMGEQNKTQFQHVQVFESICFNVLLGFVSYA